MLYDADSVIHVMVSLLTNFRWLNGRWAASGRALVVSDSVVALSSVFTSESTRKPVSLLSFGERQVIRGLRRDLVVIKFRVNSESDGELASALYQRCRLLQGEDGEYGDCGLAGNLGATIERDARGLWIKPLNGYSSRTLASDAGVKAETVIDDGDEVEAVCGLGDGSHVISGHEDGVVCVPEGCFLETVLELHSHTAWIICLTTAEWNPGAFSFIIFSGAGDQTVRIWEISIGSREGVKLVKESVVLECRREVMCVACSSEGRSVTAGCENGDIFV